jgi:hypothetical protein
MNELLSTYFAYAYEKSNRPEIAVRRLPNYFRLAHDPPEVGPAVSQPKFSLS